MKKTFIIFFIPVILACASCKTSFNNTSSVGNIAENSSTHNSIDLRSEMSPDDLSKSDDTVSESKSSVQIASENKTLDRATALSIATDLVKRYQNYDNYGIACVFDYDYDCPQNEYDEMWNMLSEDQKGYLSGRVYKCKCCSTYDQAKKHLYNCIDSSLTKYVSKDYVEYKGNLFFFGGAVGSISYNNVKVIQCNEKEILAHADLYGSGDNYCGKYAFSIQKENGRYVIKRAQEVVSY